MEWLQQIPASIWDLPIQMLVIVLLSLGVFVTKREHSNMTKMMEYFRGLCDTKDSTIKTQAETIGFLRDAGLTTKKVVETVREVAKGESDVSEE
jgi:hypothetical protein